MKPKIERHAWATYWNVRCEHACGRLLRQSYDPKQVHHLAEAHVHETGHLVVVEAIQATDWYEAEAAS